ncbi:hypothetical protein Tco_1369181 [Tanacetum coccineum]
MADPIIRGDRWKELLQIPIIGIEDAIVVPAVLAYEFELKIELLDFISSNPFFGLDDSTQFCSGGKSNDMKTQEAIYRVLPSNTVTDPRTELKAITTMDGLTLDGSFIPYSNFLVYQEKEQEPETITKVVEISSSQSTPLVPPPETPPVSDSHPEEFADELVHIKSPPKYDRFYFDIEVDPGKMTRLLKENLSSKIKEDNELKPKTPTKELTIHELNNFSLLLSDCDSIFSEEFFEINFLVTFPSENKDKIFDPRIFIIKGVQSHRFHILPLEDFSTISFVSDSLLLIDPSEIETFLSFPSGNEDKVFDPRILIINGVSSFTRKSPRLLIDNFMIDKCHILSEISLKIESSVIFHPKDKEIRGELS